MQNGKIVASVLAVWGVAVATIALPGVAQCGGGALGDALGSIALLLGTLTAAVGLAGKRERSVGKVCASLVPTHA